MNACCLGELLFCLFGSEPGNHIWGGYEVNTRSFSLSLSLVREEPDTSNFSRHVMRAILSIRPKCSNRCISLKESPLRPVLVLKHTTKNSTKQTSMRTKWF